MQLHTLTKRALVGLADTDIESLIGMLHLYSANSDELQKCLGKKAGSLYRIGYRTEDDRLFIVKTVSDDWHLIMKK